MAVPTLETERLILHALTVQYCSKAYVDWMNDSEVHKYMVTRGDYTIEKLKDYLEEQERNETLFWAIHIKDSGKHIVNIKIDPIDEADKSGEYGIMMGDKDEWGKGYAGEASVAVLRFCFDELGLLKITLGVKPDNTRAVKLYEKLGFKGEEIDMDRGGRRMSLENNQ